MIYNIAIVGKPNVGKTTLINKMVKRKVAIVHDQPGVTRDRQHIKYKLKNGLECNLIDTPGIDFQIKTSMQEKMHSQTEMAIKEASICLFVVDGKNGIDERDRIISNMLRKYSHKTVLLINKCDNDKMTENLEDFYRFGFEEMLFISAEHKIGFSDIMNLLIDDSKNYEDLTSSFSKEKKLRIGIVGRPNVGKSTFMNNLLKEERCVVSEVAGTTRDAINIDIKIKDLDVTLIDTAGIRKKILINDKLEDKMISSSFHAINMSDISILIISAEDGLTSQDMHILDYILKESRVPVICVNKIDKIKNSDRFMKNLTQEITNKVHLIVQPLIFGLSAMNDYDLSTIIVEANRLYEKFCEMHKTSYLNKILEKFNASNQPVYVRKSTVKFKYISQVKAKPPYFIISSNFEEKEIKTGYVTMFQKFLITSLELQGIPIRMKFIKSHNPYAKQKN